MIPWMGTSIYITIEVTVHQIVWILLSLVYAWHGCLVYWVASPTWGSVTTGGRRQWRQYTLTKNGIMKNETAGGRKQSYTFWRDSVTAGGGGQLLLCVVVTPAQTQWPSITAQPSQPLRCSWARQKLCCPDRITNSHLCTLRPVIIVSRLLAVSRLLVMTSFDKWTHGVVRYNLKMNHMCILILILLF